MLKYAVMATLWLAHALAMEKAKKLEIMNVMYWCARTFSNWSTDSTLARQLKDTMDMRC